MQSRNQARANAARLRQAETGESYAAALAAVRQDRLERFDQVHAEPPSDSAVPNFHGQPVPPELPRLLRYYSWRIARYLHDAQVESRSYDEDFADWQRLTLYKLSDALEHFHILIGVITAYLRDVGVPAPYLRRYLQVTNDRHVEAFYTPRVEDFLAGLTRQAAEDSTSDIWHRIGTEAAVGSFEPDGEALEVVLNALFANWSDDDMALDHLPMPLQHRVRKLLPILGADPQGEDGETH